MRAAESKRVNRQLLDYLAKSLGFQDDIVGLIEWMFDESVSMGETHRSLAGLTRAFAARVQGYCGRRAESGVNVLGRPFTNEERERYRKWHQEITDLLGGGDQES